MRRNRVFRQEEYFPHPNLYVENNRTYQRVLFELFTQVKFKITRWANNHFDKFSCETVGLEIRKRIFPIFFSVLP